MTVHIWLGNDAGNEGDVSVAANYDPSALAPPGVGDIFKMTSRSLNDATAGLATIATVDEIVALPSNTRNVGAADGSPAFEVDATTLTWAGAAQYAWFDGTYTTVKAVNTGNAGVLHIKSSTVTTLEVQSGAVVVLWGTAAAPTTVTTLRNYGGRVFSFKYVSSEVNANTGMGTNEATADEVEVLTLENYAGEARVPEWDGGAGTQALKGFGGRIIVLDGDATGLGSMELSGNGAVGDYRGDGAGMDVIGRPGTRFTTANAKQGGPALNDYTVHRRHVRVINSRGEGTTIAGTDSSVGVDPLDDSDMSSFIIDPEDPPQ